MKIKTKLLMGVSTVPILIIILISIGWFQLTNLGKMSTSLQDGYRLSYLAGVIQLGVKDEAINLRNLVIYKDEARIENELALLQKNSNDVTRNIDLLESSELSQEQRTMVQALINTNIEFNAYKEKLLKLLNEDNKQEAINLINSKGHNLQGKFSTVISEITNHFNASLQASFDDFLLNFRREILFGSIVALLGSIIIFGLGFRLIWTITKRLRTVSKLMSNVASGKADLSTKVEVVSDDEIDDVAKSFNSMARTLEEQQMKEQDLMWIKSNIAEITTSLSAIQDLNTLSNTFLSRVAPLMDSSHAVLYMKDIKNQKEPVYKLFASYAMKERKTLSNAIRIGEGLIGQAALEKSPIILTEVPSNYIRVESGLGQATPLTIYVVPVIFEGDVKAVVELASFKRFNSKQQDFIEEMMKGLAIILDSVIGRIRLADLLGETQELMEEVQAQSEELQVQQEELRTANEELEEQAVTLRQSEEQLQSQQEELEHTNKELQEKAELLEEQNRTLGFTNEEVERARAELEEKARQLTLSSKYKSEFLANMSHELRTPLNSLLILSKLLSDNPDKNFTEKQIEYAKTIHSSGKDLLMLINDILDLAKIESGKMQVNISKVRINELVELVEQRFRPIANEKNLGFKINLVEGLTEFIYNDEKRVLQVLENLLSNAFKFTHKGEVSLNIDYQQSLFSFSVRDTGIGIPKEQHEHIFEAFQQADGTTSRKYGGTGLGLSICREIAALVSGEIELDSEEGKGSTFSFYVPNLDKDNLLHLDEVAVTKERSVEIPEPVSRPFITIEPSNDIKRLLIVDEDIKQRNRLMEMIADKNVIIKAVSTGAEALEALKVSQFDFIVLDIGISDTPGFSLLEKIFIGGENEHLKVFIYTGKDLSSKDEMYLKKYVHAVIIKDEHAPQRLKDELELHLHTDNEKNDIDYDEIRISPDLKGKKILLVDDDVRNVYALSNILELYGMSITFAENGIEALELLEKTSDFDLILMDIMMPEMDGYEAIQQLRTIPQFSRLPVIALTAKAMKEDREKCMEVGASDYIVKPVHPDQLISLIRVWLYKDEGKRK